MKSERYEPRPCEICGKMYRPGRCDQRTCGDPECMRARQRRNYLEYRRKNYASVLETNRRSMAKKREKREQDNNPPKPDTIVAIGYAERQKAATLAKAGKVKTEL